MLLVLAMLGCATDPSPVEEDTAAFAIMFRAPERYEVVRGDTLNGIARKLDVTVDELREWNGSLVGDHLEIGDVLLVWPRDEKPATARAARPAKRASSTAPLVLTTATVDVPRLRRAGVLGALDDNASVAASLGDDDVDELTASIASLRADPARAPARSATGMLPSSTYDDGRSGPSTTSRAASPARTATPSSTAVAPRLTLPARKSCLAGPRDVSGDYGMVGSSGLSLEQVRTATRAFLPKTTSCVSTAGSVTTEITVGCDGRVTEVSVLGSERLPAASVDCVQKALYYAPFPAHDSGGGFTFQLPISFSG